jgi:predicted nucleic acid-binding protein
MPVVDASVAIKLVLAEDDSDLAELLFERSLVMREALWAPPHAFSEVVNAIYRRVRRGGTAELSATEGARAVERFLALPIRSTNPPGLYQRAYELAQTHLLVSIYDSLYIALAELLQTELWTADKRLINTVGHDLPWVRPIHDYV